MQGWRTKFTFLLIVYFAGFATAIYCLAPVPESQRRQPCERTFAYSALKSDEFTQSFNAGMDKCLAFVKDVAWRTGKYAKQKVDERRLQVQNNQ